MKNRASLYLRNIYILEEYFRFRIDFFCSACHYKKISGSIREYVLVDNLHAFVSRIFFSKIVRKVMMIAAFIKVADDFCGGNVGQKL
nr:hypothetical protein [uncultured Bacillus sp.]